MQNCVLSGTRENRAMPSQRGKLKIISGQLAAVSSGKEIAVEDQADHLGWTSGKVLSHGDTLFHNAAQMEMFQTGRRDMGPPPDDRGEREKLGRLDRSSLNGNFDWSKLAAQFRAVLGRRETYSTPGPESGHEWWFMKRSEEVRQPYETLAKRGLKALGLPGGI